MHVYLCQRFRSRLKGLLFKKELDPDHYYVFDRCASIHTFGMQFALTVLFADQNGKLLSYHSVPPWRMHAHKGAYYTIECSEKNNITPHEAQKICQKVIEKLSQDVIKI